MTNKINSLVINQNDSVAVALVEFEGNNTAMYKLDGKIMSLNVLGKIPIYHKFSIKDIKKGELIYKYGQVIGRAIQNIKKGQHVHSQNLVSIREFI